MSTPNYVRGMIESDRALERTANLRGLESAYRSTFAADAQVLAGAVVPAAQWLSHQTFEPGDKIFWDVNRAEISSSGQLGYTTGAWTRLRKGVYTNGDFVRVWKKEKREWRIALQAEVSTGLPRVATGEVNIPKRGTEKTKVSSTADMPSALTTLERDMGERKGDVGKYFASNAYILRQGVPPTTGFTPDLLLVEAKIREESFAVAPRSDLACSLGTMQSDPNPRPFLRVWRWLPVTGWTIVLEYVG